MQVIVDLPEDIASQLAPDELALSRAVIEALAMEGVRSGKLSTGQARRLLGFETRMDVHAFLKERGLVPSISAEDVERDAETSLASRVK